jgi:hypothetical protein
MKGEEGDRVRKSPLGLGLLLGGAVFAYGLSSGCRKAEILAINDDGEHLHMCRSLRVCQERGTQHESSRCAGARAGCDAWAFQCDSLGCVLVVRGVTDSCVPTLLCCRRCVA